MSACVYFTASPAVADYREAAATATWVAELIDIAKLQSNHDFHPRPSYCYPLNGNPNLIVAKYLWRLG